MCLPVEKIRDQITGKGNHNNIFVILSKSVCRMVIFYKTFFQRGLHELKFNLTDKSLDK